MKKYHIVYKTTNIVNNKIYVGIHSTNRLEDGYIGSGWVLKDAIKKYGKDKFFREVLYLFHTREAALAMEAEIVDQEFIDRTDTYNLVLGGLAGAGAVGEANHMYGKVAHNAKALVATHKDGRRIEASSIRELQEHIGIDRANIRNLIKKGIRGRRGWKVKLL